MGVGSSKSCSIDDPRLTLTGFKLFINVVSR